MKSFRIAVLATLLILTGTVFAYGDIGETHEIKFNAYSSGAYKIRSKATELGSPVKIYEYVLNNTEYALYHGSRSGSINSFLGARGNDVDLASTLIAMLRSQGIHARYVVGNIRVSSDKVMNWLGVTNADLAASIMNDQGIQGPDRTEGAVEVHGAQLSTDKASITFEHTWVEALISYSNYRGVGSDSTTNCTGESNTCRWVSLDPSFKLKQYKSDTIDILSVRDGKPAFEGFDYNRYYNAIKENDPIYRDKNPLNIYEGLILDYLRINDPGKTLEDVADAGIIIKQDNKILPASLPYEVIGIPRRYDSVYDHDLKVGTTERAKWNKKLRWSVFISDGDHSFTSQNGIGVSLVDASTKRLTLTLDVRSGTGLFDTMAIRLGGVVIDSPLRGTVVSGFQIKLGMPFTLNLTMDGAPSTRTDVPDKFVSASYPDCVVGGYYLIATGGETSNWSQVHLAADELLQANQRYKIVNDASGDPHLDTNGNSTKDDGELRLLDHKQAMDDLTGGLLHVAAMLYYAKYRESVE